MAARADLERFATSRARLSGEWPWKFRLLEAEVLLGQAEAKKALELLEKNAPAPSSQLEARRLADLADAYLKLDRVDDAKRVLAEAAPLSIASGQTRLSLHISLVESAFLVRTRQFPQAEGLLRELLKDAAKASDGYYQAGARINLSMIALRQARWDEAVGLSQQALADAQRVGALRFAAVAATNLAVAYSQLGDYDRARDARGIASSTLEVTGDRRNLQSSLGELGTILLREGDPTSASVQYERAYRLAEQLGMHSAARNWATNMAYSLVLQRNWARAQEWTATSRRLAEAVDPASLSQIDLIDSVIAYELGDYRRFRVLLDALRSRSKMDPTLSLMAETNYALLERATNNVAASNRRFENMLRMLDAGIGQIRDAPLRVTFRSRLIEMYREYVDSLIDQGRLDRALEVGESSRAQLLAEKLGDKSKAQANNAREVLAKAKACNCTFVSYWLAPDRSFAFVVKPSGLTYAQLPPIEEITKLAAAYRRDLLDGMGDPLRQETAANLSTALLGPLEKHIPPGSRVVVVPDGPIHNINLEALPAPSGVKRYWIEDVTMALAPSLAVLETGRPGPLKSALLVGAPSFDSPDFPRLPYAHEELNIIKSRLAGVPSTVYEGGAATPKAYLQEAPRLHSLIHFAAHADVRQENPFNSSVILSGSGGSERLYGHDIAAQPLQAELVTVSACKSAGAKAYAGEGLTGLAWAFLQSGARRVVAGSWDVSDRSSLATMDSLYRSLNSGHSPVESLREAKLSLLRSGTGMSHPFYWAPLQMYVRVISKAK